MYRPSPTTLCGTLVRNSRAPVRAGSVLRTRTIAGRLRLSMTSGLSSAVASPRQHASTARAGGRLSEHVGNANVVGDGRPGSGRGACRRPVGRPAGAPSRALAMSQGRSRESRDRWRCASACSPAAGGSNRADRGRPAAYFTVAARRTSSTHRGAATDRGCLPAHS